MMGILSAIYSVFAPFMQNIGDVVNFNSAYYGALAGIERGQLVLKYKQPGFEGSGGILKGIAFGPVSDSLSGNFGLLNNGNNGFARTISSRTNRIPNEGQGNVDYLFTSGTDSKNYNKLPYYTSEKIILSLDATKYPSEYYTGNSEISYFSGGSFSGIIRLPPKAMERFGGRTLCDTCDLDEDGISDDIIVNWILDGIYNGIPFSIVPTISIFYYSGGNVDSDQDIAIRKSVINDTGSLYFGDYAKGFSPLSYNNKLVKHTILSLDNTLETSGFNNILSNNINITGLKLGFGITNLLSTTNNEIYPFLEYQFSFPQPVSDSFFTLQGIGLVGDYNVKIFVKKTTNENTSSIGDFTIIF